MAPPLRRNHPYLPRDPPAPAQGKHPWRSSRLALPQRPMAPAPAPPTAPAPAQPHLSSQVPAVAPQPQPQPPAPFKPLARYLQPQPLQPPPPAPYQPPARFKPPPARYLPPPPPQPPPPAPYQPPARYLPPPPPQPPPQAPPTSLEDDDMDDEVEFYLSEGDIFEEFEEFDEKTQTIFRGLGWPRSLDSEPFDKTFIFGNVVALNFHQVLLLRSMAGELPRPPTKEYICTLWDYNVLPANCSLEFTPKYTSTYLLRFVMIPSALRLGIPVRTQTISVAVCSSTSAEKKYCKMKYQMSGKAIVYGEAWTEAIHAFYLKDGDVCLFRFKDGRLVPKKFRDPEAWLTMEIVKIEKGEEGE